MTKSSSESPRPPNDALEAEVVEIAERFLDGLESAERPDREALVAARPDLAPWLEERLVAIELVHDFASESRTGAPSGRIRCPHCGRVSAATRPATRSDGSEGGRSTCSDCGRTFRVDRATLKTDADDLPERIGRFDVVAFLGRGAFGNVYKAIDPDLGRRVAIKIPRAGYFTADEEARFLREARSAAKLRHPGIVAAHEIGDARGVPFLVSDYVEGVSLEERTPGPETPAEAARIARAIAEALHYAHESGIVHRDVKPGNVIVDGAGDPHLTDFGLARHDEGEVTVTIDGQLLGTPAFMSPEQARGTVDAIDRRSDVYSLGVVLYELLTGERPFRGSRSVVLSQVLSDEPRPPRALNDRIPIDLETICLKAMAKEPNRRYATANALAEDLGRFLCGEPISARPVGRLEKTWRWARRQPVVAGLLASVAFLIVAVAAVSLVAAVWLSRAVDESGRRLVHAHIQNGSLRLDRGDAGSALPWFVEALRFDEGKIDREEVHRTRIGAAFRYHPRLLRVWFDDEPARVVAFGPGGEIALSYSGTTVKLLDVEGGAIAKSWQHSAAVVDAVLDPLAARWTVVACADRSLHIRDLSEPSSDARVEMEHVPSRLAVHPRGELVVSADAGGHAIVWDPERSREIRRFAHRGAVSDLAISPDGKLLATAGRKSGVSVWELSTGRSLGEFLRDDDGSIVRWAHDSKTLFSCFGRRMITWDTAKLEALAEWIIGADIRDAAWCPNDLTVAIAATDGWARYWLPLRQWGTLGDAKSSALTSVEFDPAGLRLVTGRRDGRAELWTAGALTIAASPLHHSGAVTSTTFHPGGYLVLTASEDGTTRLWDLTPGPRVTGLDVRGDPEPISDEDETRRLRVDRDSVRVHATASGVPLAPPMRHPREVELAAFGDGKTRIVSATRRNVRIWEAATADPITPWLRHDRPLASVRLAEDGARLVTRDDIGIEREFEFAPEARSVGELAVAAKILAASEIDSAGGFVRLSPEATRRAWERLLARGQPALPTELAIGHWHFRESIDAYRDERWRDAVWHLDRSLPPIAGSARVHGMLGRAYGELGDWSAAANHYEESIAEDSTTARYHFRLAVLCLALGDDDRYRAVSERMAVVFGSNATRADRQLTAATAVLGPGAVTEVEPFARLLREKHFSFRLTTTRARILGALHLRAGNLEEALAVLSGLRFNPRREMTWKDAIFLALAFHANDNAAAAEKWLRRGIEEVEQIKMQHFFDRLERRVLLLEAKEQILGTGENPSASVR